MSAAPQGYVFYVWLHVDLNENSVSGMRLTQKSVRCLRPADILQNGATLNQRREIVELSSFVFFAQKKCSRRLINFRLNHWWQMDYSDNAFHTFLGQDSENCLAVNGTFTSIPVFIQNILNSVLKTNEAFTGLEQHGGKWLMTTFSFWGGVSL